MGVGPWLPWLEMATEKGGHLYSAPFIKLRSVEDLPEDFLQWTVLNYPEYLHPPKNFTKPNMTSWRVFKGIIDSRRAAGEPDIQVPDQSTKGEIKKPNLDPSVMDHLASLGDLAFFFEGSSYVIFEGQTGQDLLWMDGNLTVSFGKAGFETWSMNISMEGDTQHHGRRRDFYQVESGSILRVNLW